MEIIKKVLNVLHGVLEYDENSKEAQEGLVYAIELLSSDDINYNSTMVSDELLNIIINLQSNMIEDSIYELEVMLNEIEE